MNRAVLAVGALVVVPLVVFLAIGLTNDPRSVDSPLLGQPAPDFRLLDLEGQAVTLSEFAGRPVVVNFWSTWCVPCMYEHPLFLAATRFYGDRVVFLGIIYQDDPQAIARFNAQRGAWGRSLIDPGGQVAHAFGVYGVPETYFISADGVLVDKVTSAVDGEHMKTVLEGLL